MRCPSRAIRYSGGLGLLTVMCLACWLALVALPLAVGFWAALGQTVESEVAGRIYASLLRSVTLAAVISAAAVLLGYMPGELLSTATMRPHRRDLLLLLLLMPLVLPQYLLYYAWSLLLSPTTSLGAFLGRRPELARFVGTSSSCVVLILWYWPLAALVIAQGWRNIDRQVWDCASLEAGRFQIFKRITLPLLAGPVLLSFAVCFALSLSEFATFHLAGIQTIGTELAVLYQETGSEAQLAAAAWPVAAVALAAAVAIGRNSRTWGFTAAVSAGVEFRRQKSRWAVTLAVVGISLVVPLALLAANLRDVGAFGAVFTLHLDELLWSLLIAVVAALGAHLIALAPLLLDRTAGKSIRRTAGAGAVFARIASLAVQTSIFLAMFVPASVVAASLLRMLAAFGLPGGFRQGWYIVSAGQAARFAGIALILQLLSRYSQQRQLSEMAAVDGASPLATWRHIHLPNSWPLIVASLILVAMLGMTELSATMVLLPAGLPNFAQRLLNQMHYARQQEVISSCLVLGCLFLVLAGALVVLLRMIRLRRLGFLGAVVVSLLFLTGCADKSGDKPGSASESRQESAGAAPRVLYSFGRTGRGRGEFVYPRAIDVKQDGSVFVVDKTGRIQHFAADGAFRAVLTMPLVEAGKPTGLSVAPNGNLYVADTHYHRVVIFSPEGRLIDQFGRFGQEGGCFIYPTDVAFSEDGRIFVSEYGGNDRVSVFDSNNNFLYCFGSPGSEQGRFARPAALCVDKSRRRLYVVDACNHRIGIYGLEGNLIGYIGSAGTEKGRLRYPYDLALLSDGTLVVCEYGNNRLQLFSPQGESLAVYGGPGRRLGQLAYPWGVAVDGSRRAFVVDAGNNRIQVWQL